MKGFVQDLVIIVGGTANGVAGRKTRILSSKRDFGGNMQKPGPEMLLTTPAPKVQRGNGKVKTASASARRPDNAIPFDEEMGEF
ncbi:MAG: hypothetical protein AB9866_02595 [Syntrophobacteraceae bacterium]